MNLPAEVVQRITSQAANTANLDDRLPTPLLDNGIFNPSFGNTLAIDYNQVDIAMAFIGYQQKRRRSKKKMDPNSLTQIYELLDEVAYDALHNAISSSMSDILPSLMEDAMNRNG